MASNHPENPPPYSEAIKQPPYNLAQDGPAPKYSTHQQAQPPYPPPGKFKYRPLISTLCNELYKNNLLGLNHCIQFHNLRAYAITCI